MILTPNNNWNFGDLLDCTAAQVPGDRPALICGDRTIVWRAFDARSNNLARTLLASGLATGDRIAILARNIPEYIEVAAAAFKARLTYVNINYRYTTAEIDYVLKDSGARALFYQDQFAGIAAPLVESLDLAAQIGGIPAAGSIGYETLLEGDGAPLGIERSPDDAYLLYTGGTTGKPKGVVWRSGDTRAIQLESPTIKTPVRTMDEHARQVRDNPAPGRVIPACPLMHGAGINSSITELIAGGTVILLESERFDVEELWDAADRHRATRILIVGDVFARPMARALELEPRRWALDAMRVISSAGLMWSEDVKASLVKSLPLVTLIDILGASEASSLGLAITTATSSTPTGYFEPGIGSVIIDVETSRVLGPDEVGQGWLARTEPFAIGYFGDDAKTAQTFPTIDGVRYAIPGDMAARGADGRLRLLGRGNMCINTGGEKVFPEEVEEALTRQDGVEDAIVLGMPDEKWGSAVIALIRASAGYDEALTRSKLGETLAPYKIPKHLLRVDEVPRHASGKGDYRQGAAMAASLLNAPA